MKLHIDIKSVLERYNSIREPCPQCGKLMVPLGDSSVESYLWCFDCKTEKKLPRMGEGDEKMKECPNGSVYCHFIDDCCFAHSDCMHCEYRKREGDTP